MPLVPLLVVGTMVILARRRIDLTPLNTPAPPLSPLDHFDHIRILTSLRPTLNALELLVNRRSSAAAAAAANDFHHPQHFNHWLKTSHTQLYDFQTTTSFKALQYPGCSSRSRCYSSVFNNCDLNSANIILDF
ncbi:hypothetical protein C8R43DRAFT_1142393 [Mycena crocata]|nr:hypothetical protein C8R43DRAFT_1142393 [Mycena crocata]